MPYDFQPLPTRTEVVTDWAAVVEKVKAEGRAYVNLGNVKANAAHVALYRHNMGVYQVKDGTTLLGYVVEPIHRRNTKRKSS